MTAPLATPSVNPLLYPQLWTIFTLGNVPSPGVCEIGPCKRIYDWDKKKGKGAQGAVLTYQGFTGVEFDVTLKLWRYPWPWSPQDPDDFAAWEAYAAQLIVYDPAKDPASQAKDIYHPQLVTPKVKSVVTKDFTSPTHQGGGMYHATINFWEFGPPPAVNASTTPAGSSTTVDVRSVGQQPASAEQLLKELEKQAQNPF